MSLNRAENLELAKLLREKERRVSVTKIARFYPDTGSLRRELYPKHTEFFAAGSAYRERLMLAANRVGKTEGVGCYELTLHLTGVYPAWWVGKRFPDGVRAWAVGDTGKTVREILQNVLLGPVGQYGTGLIPQEAIHRVRKGMGGGDVIECVYVKHVSGGMSELLFKSYDQRRVAFQGTSQDVILLDEEPPHGIYVECLLRTMTTGGIIMATFMPLLGKTEVVKQFLPGFVDEKASRKLIIAGWNDVPHLTEEMKTELYTSIPPYQREARCSGVPQLGAGAIYPMAEADFVVKDFALPATWPCAYGMDVGWNRTAAIWGALDKATDTLYLYSEHYRGQAEPVVHTSSITAKGAGLVGCIDPASRSRSQKDGMHLLDIYRSLGLKLTPSPNAKEAGIFAVWTRLASGRLKVMASLSNWLNEFRSYSRNSEGEVIETEDHLMDATRYLIMSAQSAFTSPRAPDTEIIRRATYQEAGAWMG